ncbi:FecR domain-containing protein [uncultured Bacteroides sp.]|uniref:FecR family protein n=1 Tax=uncultured Bacteroides sp. TaxID=162156 RepID=UPI002AA92282|nr:FecR domain-containing protein [uncultured Bacteroides sp.]
MILREEKDRGTDRAWNKLHERLEQEGLLAFDNAPQIRPIGKSLAMRWVASVAVLLVCGVSAFLIIRSMNSLKTESLVLNNGKGEPTLVTKLEDGSIVYLSEQASLEYPERFAEDKREIVLHGDAFFEISSNKKRPFIINTSTAIVEVIGTKFNVKSKNSSLFSLAVRSGVVKVTSKKSGKSIYVKAGETALLRADKLQALQTSDFAQFNSYLRYVHFKDQRLSDVVRIINENTDSLQLKVAPELGDRLITVTFSNDSPSTMANLICMALDLQLTKKENIIYITR